MNKPDIENQIDLNPSLALEKLDSWLDMSIKLLPNFVVALVVFFIFYLLGRLAKRLVLSSARRKSRENLGEILGGFLKAAITVLGSLLAATIIVPTLHIGDLIAGLGVSSVAIGFAFKDILQNWLAGLLILLRQPFDLGDQVEINGYEGTVEQIETRATIIKTYDGQKAVIPNSDIYTNAVLVKTAYPKRRSQYDIGIGYGDNIQEACDIIKKTLATIDNIEKDPEPEAFAWDLSASWVTIRVRWWTDSQRSDVVKNQSAVILVLKQALDEAQIDMPYETQVHLFHDQTEERDGVPGEQREGWPAPPDKTVQSRWKKEKIIEQSEADAGE